MALRATTRLVAAGAGIALGLGVASLARRARGAQRRDPARELQLDSRRKRMREARDMLIAAQRNGTP